MGDQLTEILQEKGPLLSSEVLKLLTLQHGLTPQAARQRVSRREKVIRALEGVSFPKNARFLYLQSDYGSPRFWPALVAALEQSSPAYSCALAALSERGGIMPKRHFSIACGAPLAQKKHLSPDQILQRLITAGLLEEFDVADIGACVGYARRDVAYFSREIADMRSRLIIEDLALVAIKTWARNLALGSFDKFALRGGDALPTVGTFAWDLTAPSYLSGLTGASKSGGPKPGFIACDVLLGRRVTEAGIKPFLRKCTTLRHLKNVGRCLQFFLADSYSQSAHRAARRSGIVPATVESLFGEELAKALGELAQLLKGAAAVVVDPVKFDVLFRQLGKIEGAAGTLRGALFEFVVADLVRKLWGAQVELNRVLREAGRQLAEIDVLAIVPGRRVYFIECKGHAPHTSVDEEEIKKWLTKRIPAIRKKALEHPEWRNLELHFELWTSGKLSDEASALIQHASESTHRYTISHRSGGDIGELAREVNDPSLKKVLEDHFLEHPLSGRELVALTSTAVVPEATIESVLATEDFPLALPNPASGESTD